MQVGIRVITALLSIPQIILKNFGRVKGFLGIVQQAIIKPKHQRRTS
jgi:hypothetical protein